MSKLEPTTVKIDDTVKREAETILKDLGMSRTQAINVFYRQIIINKGLPFQVTTKTSAEREREYLESTGTLQLVYDRMKNATDDDFEQVR